MEKKERNKESEWEKVLEEEEDVKACGQANDTAKVSGRREHSLSSRNRCAGVQWMRGAQGAARWRSTSHLSDVLNDRVVVFGGVGLVCNSARHLRHTQLAQLGQSALATSGPHY